MTTTDPVISIIVPVYNSELYLEDCIRSIVQQTYLSLEIILVNDGSTDRSQEIISDYSARDKRIVVLSQPNRGVSAARNAGLRVANGEYVLFVDSDDALRSDAVEMLCRRAISTNADIVIGNFYLYNQNGERIIVYRGLAEFANQAPLSGEECYSQLMEVNTFPPLVYLYFTRNAFIRNNNLFFEEGIIHEDELWTIKVLIQARQVSFIDCFHYSYYVRQGSLMQSDNKAYRIQSFISVCKALEAFAIELQDKKTFLKAAGYVYVRIFYIYLLICKLLFDLKADKNIYKEYFNSLMGKIYPTLTHLQQLACSDYFSDGNSLLFGPTLSFCITCKNRFSQIKQTLPQNLEDNRDHKDMVQFVLVDFGSTDGLQEWIVDNFMHEIDEGYLKYYYTEELKSWHCCIAKNTSHMLADHDVVVNLDCDNFTGKNGGMFLIDHMKKFGWKHTIVHQFSNDFKDGSYGRIALSKNNFIQLGGYDESFEPAGYQDIDFLLRAQLMNLDCFNLPDKDYCRAVMNRKDKTIANISSNLSWEEMKNRNYRLSIKNITSGKLKANAEKDHIGIIENIYTFVSHE